MTSVVQRLEESTSGLITKPELEAAIAEASQEHQIVLSAQTTEALVDSLFEQADVEKLASSHIIATVKHMMRDKSFN